MKAIFFKFQRFFLRFERVLVQLLLIQTLISVQFYMIMKAILSSRVNRLRVMVDS